MDPATFVPVKLDILELIVKKLLVLTQIHARMEAHVQLMALASFARVQTDTVVPTVK